MSLQKKLAVVFFVLAGMSGAQAGMIEFDLSYELGPISGDFGTGQTLSGVGTRFPDETVVFDVGDTLVFNILFDQLLAVIDVGPPTDEVFSFGLNVLPDTLGFGGTWTSSLETLGAFGDTWADPIVSSFTGGGAGFGWGGVAANVTDSLGIFDGIRWTTTLTSAREGAPMTLYAFTGVQLSADGIAIIPNNSIAGGSGTDWISRIYQA